MKRNKYLHSDLISGPDRHPFVRSATPPRRLELGPQVLALRTGAIFQVTPHGGTAGWFRAVSRHPSKLEASTPPTILRGVTMHYDQIHSYDVRCAE
jgi:hypothetical protein